MTQARQWADSTGPRRGQSFLNGFRVTILGDDFPRPVQIVLAHVEIVSERRYGAPPTSPRTAGADQYRDTGIDQHVFPEAGHRLVGSGHQKGYIVAHD
jgi:hypothetical protein